MGWVDKSALNIQNFFHKPMKVFWFCLAFGILSLLFNGSFLRLYSLHRDFAKLTSQISDLKLHMGQLDAQLKMAKDPSFIQQQAFDNYDLVSENDLVFVFADE